MNMLITGNSHSSVISAQAGIPLRVPETETELDPCLRRRDGIISEEMR